MSQRLLLGVLLSASLCWTPAWASPKACGSGTHVLTVVNNSADEVWVRVVSGCYPGKFPQVNGTSDGQKTCWPDVANGGFALAGQADGQPASTRMLTVPPCWSGALMVQCAACATGIVSQVEFTLDGGLDVSAGALKKLPGFDDNYDLSLVNGFTKMLEVTPDSPSTGGPACRVAGCTKTPACPALLQDGDACLSPIQLATRRPEKLPAAQPGDPDPVLKYGCTCAGGTSCPAGAASPGAAAGGFCCSPLDLPGKTHPDSACCPFPAGSSGVCAASPARAWGAFTLDYIKAVHSSCPQGYAWQFDDTNHIFKCSNESGAALPTKGRNYTISIH